MRKIKAQTFRDMTLSELIADLTKHIARYGDIRVWAYLAKRVEEEEDAGV